MKKNLIVHPGKISFLFIFILAIFMLTQASASAEERVDGYYIHEYSVDEITYYMLSDSRTANGAFDFYSEISDSYSNIYSGWDVSINFYRGWNDADCDKAKAFSKYLLNRSESKTKSSGWFYYGNSDAPTAVFVYLIEGCNIFDSSYTMQNLINRNPWMNCDAVKLTLCTLSKGKITNEDMKYAYNNLGCSFVIHSQPNNQWGGTNIGFAFTEYSYEQVVRKYCPEEINSYN